MLDNDRDADGVAVRLKVMVAVGGGVTVALTDSEKVMERLSVSSKDTDWVWDNVAEPVWKKSCVTLVDPWKGARKMEFDAKSIVADVPPANPVGVLRYMWYPTMMPVFFSMRIKW